MSIPRSIDSALPTSYWHATFAPPVPDDPLTSESEVVIVGGGLLGCWTAYWLARQGVEVTLLEREVISWGATGRNGGFLTGGAALGYGAAIEAFGRETTRDLWTMAADGQALARQVIADEEIDCDFRAPGRVSLVLSDDELEVSRRNLDLLHEDGFGGEVVDRQSMQELIATPISLEIVGGVFTDGDGLLHSGRYIAGVAAAARRHGARLCQAGVTALTPEADGVVVSTSAGEIRAQQVVVAVNAWSEELLPQMRGAIVPVRGQILAYEPMPQIFSTGVFTDITPTGEYWQQTPDGSIVIGGCRALAQGGDVGVRELMPTPDVTSRIEEVLPRLFPELATLRVARHWAGPMAFTKDYVPITDAAPGLPGVWVTGGFCGHGMPFGPRVGQLLAEAVVAGTVPEALAPLRLQRETLVAPMA